MEHSERGEYVTSQVSVWICNDGEHVELARRASNRGSAHLKTFLIGVISKGRHSSSPWHVAQELAPNDYERVDWDSVARDLQAT